MWFGNSLHPQATTNKFHYNKFGIIKLVQRCSHKPRSQIHPNNSLSQIQNQRTKYESKNQRFTNTKYELRTNQRESHKSNPKVAMHQERANHQTAKPKPSGNKLLSLFQIATRKYQRTKQRESLFLTHTFSSLLSNFSQQHYAYIGDLSRLVYPNPRKTRLLFHI